MMMATVFLSGMTTAMFLVAAVFFLKFWRASRNRFFLYFAAACGLFALERVASLAAYILIDPEAYTSMEARGFIYLLRLAGFIVILLAIIDRNRNSDRRRERAKARLP
jgi:hypothetical protein